MRRRGIRTAGGFLQGTSDGLDFFLASLFPGQFMDS